MKSPDVFLKLDVLLGHGEGGGGAGHGEDRPGVPRVDLPPPGRVGRAAAEAERAVHLAPDKLHTEPGPEGSEGGAVLSVTGVLRVSWPVIGYFKMSMTNEK